MKSTIDLPLILSANKSRMVEWWVDASYAARQNMRSQTGGTMSKGTATIYSTSRKQRFNTTSLTDTELIPADDVMSQIIGQDFFYKAIELTLY
jgi:hypothetical protein